MQVDNIGFLMAHVFLPHKTFPPWVYQVLWTNLMMYLCGAKTGKLTSSTRICIGDLARKTRLWILVTLKTLSEIGEEFRGILMQSSLQFSMVWKTFSFARLFIANFPWTLRSSSNNKKRGKLTLLEWKHTAAEYNF